MTVPSVGPRMPDGRVPVLVSSDASELVAAEAAALRDYVRTHPTVPVTAVADQLLRTRPARRHRALVLATDPHQLADALSALADGRAHPDVIRGTGAATARRVAYTFPGQGSQRPGMGRGYHILSEPYRRAIQECHTQSMRLFGTSPRDYVLGELADDDPAATDVRVIQPALFMQMVGLTAMWDAAGVTPALTVGHSQGEIAAAYRSGAMTLSDALTIVTIRARLVHELSPRGHTMAVVGIDVEECEDMLARHSGWAQLSVVNSAHILCISGKRDTVLEMVESLTAQGKFAKEIRVEYPAHTSVVSEYQPAFLDALGTYLEHESMLAGSLPCVGATLGGAVDDSMSLGDYWFWNLRNRVRFDKAISDAALTHGADLFVEMSEHPTLLLAIGETVAGIGDASTGPRQIIGTSRRDADGLAEFTRNVAAVAVADTGFRWDALTDAGAHAAPHPPLEGFPNTAMRRVHLWADRESGLGDDVNAPDWAARQVGRTVHRMQVGWLPLKRRKLQAPRRIAVLDPTGQCADLAAEICAAAPDQGAVATLIDPAGSTIGEQHGVADHDTVLLLTGMPGTKPDAAADHLAAVLADGRWRPGSGPLPEQFWWLTVDGEFVDRTTTANAVETNSPTVDLVQASISSALRCAATEYPTTRFRHLDLGTEGDTALADGRAAAVVSALHVAAEPEIAVRGSELFVKRLIPTTPDQTAATPVRPDTPHVLITGGTGKLGLEFCEYFASGGADRITLVSRSGGTTEVRRRIDAMRRRHHAAIDVVTCDIGDEAAIDELASRLPEPVGLVLHAALDYVAGPMDTISAEDIGVAIRSKVGGVRNVVRAITRADEFGVLLCSSLAATLGGRDQALYAMANRMVDVTAAELRADGIAAASVQWGLWRVQGPLDAEGVARVQGTGVVPMAPGAAIAAGLADRSADSIVLAADWAELRDLLAVLGTPQILAEIDDAAMASASVAAAHNAAVCDASASQGSASRDDRAHPGVGSAVADAASAPVPPAEPAAHGAAGPDTDRAQLLRTELAAAMGLSAGDLDLDPDLPLVALGLDSLQALDLRKRVQATLAQDLPIEAILGGATLREVIALMGADSP
ncbi:nocobactin polyketide synthase NbtC [Gordonia mangrovi]|uniref:nocobactin polyketide synthase NbtC n=1 Tax=Gordonia mangrovi TaxID=2665643 RepID=UPI0021AC2D78|nr:nocobactin polyketide synthase NbtC [Gordonia mangrovi]UVF76359.1 nocobactin polyketide synthase NbtC [Gordonia mangrovi]